MEPRELGTTQPLATEQQHVHAGRLSRDVRDEPEACSLRQTIHHADHHVEVPRREARERGSRASSTLDRAGEALQQRHLAGPNLILRDDEDARTSSRAWHPSGFVRRGPPDSEFLAAPSFPPPESARHTQMILDAPSEAAPARRMSIPILNVREVQAMRLAGRVATATLLGAGAMLRPGVSTASIDRWVRADTAARGGRPSQLGFHGFPAAVCTSRNEVVCHGIPREDVVLEPGDIVNVDVTTQLGGFHGDTSATFFIGEPSPEARHVVGVAERCRDAGVSAVRDGVRLGDVGSAIEELAKREGCSVVRVFGGHGIGRAMHQEPSVMHVGPPGRGMRLRAGMAITIEPMINLGKPEVRVLGDGWTVVTCDGSLSAQFEHTVVVTKQGCEVMTVPA